MSHCSRNKKPNVWVFEPDTLELELYERGNIVYAVDVERMITSAEVLDWVFQVQNKSWATETVVADLIQWIQVLIDPQANLCSGGFGAMLDQPVEACIMELFEEGAVLGPIK